MSILTLSQVKAYLNVTTSADDALLTLLIGAAEEMVERWCDIKLASASLEDDCDGGGLALRPTWGPLTAVSLVEDNDTGEALDADAYERRGGWILRADGGRWPVGGARFHVHYTAGYSAAPAGLTAALYEIVAQLYREKSRDAGLESESLGDYEWARREESELRDKFAARLAGYRRVAV